MHLTLKQETAAPPRKSLKAQQRAFDYFRKEYNEDRPHQALGGHVPAEAYAPSDVRLPDPPWGKPFTYPLEFETVQITRLGYLPWNGRSAFVSTALKYEDVGLEWQRGGNWRVYFGPLRLGTLRRGPRGALRFAPSKNPVLPTSLQ